MKSINQTE